MNVEATAQQLMSQLKISIDQFEVLVNRAGLELKDQYSQSEIEQIQAHAKPTKSVPAPIKRGESGQPTAIANFGSHQQKVTEQRRRQGEQLAVASAFAEFESFAKTSNAIRGAFYDQLVELEMAQVIELPELEALDAGEIVAGFFAPAPPQS